MPAEPSLSASAELSNCGLRRERGMVRIVGAQVIAEYERLSREPIETSGHSLKLEDSVERKL
jgi:hypothetical protein